MEFGEYSERQLGITESIIALVLRLLLPFRGRPVSRQTWDTLMQLLYEDVEVSRAQAIQLAREFYDSQRELHTGIAEPFGIAAPHYQFDWFHEAMEPARRGLSRSDSSESDLANVAKRAAKIVEDAGRRTILRPVEDPEEEYRDRELVGWARVATGRETCGFCLMLVSRGPSYSSAVEAGLRLDDKSALDLVEQGNAKALAQAMKRWHPGCDCKAVPVFDRKNWAGRDAYLRAEKLWKKTTSGYRGKDAVNAFRRAVERGDVSPQDFSAAA